MWVYDEEKKTIFIDTGPMNNWGETDLHKLCCTVMCLETKDRSLALLSFGSVRNEFMKQSPSKIRTKLFLKGWRIET